MRALSGRAAVVWHDVECGAYQVDLPLWEELAAANPGPVLEIGCGTGRVALHLARRGHRVTAIDREAPLVEELGSRAAAQGVVVGTVRADAAELELGEQFALILAPMQLIQLLPGRTARGACLAAVRRHLAPGGVAALAIVERPRTDVSSFPPLPDVCELHGWVYSSQPLGAHLEGEGGSHLVLERLRQTVDPEGRLREERDTVRLQLLSADELEDEAGGAGLRASGRRVIEPTESHVGSTVVLLEA